MLVKKTNNLKPILLKVSIIPIAMLTLVGFVLFRGLSLNPQKLPSTKLNKPFPEFVLPNLNNKKTVTNSILKGKPHLVHIWASWCKACRREHKTIIKLQKKYGISIIGVDYKDSTEAANKFLRNYGNPYSVLIKDPRGKLGMELGVYGTPETYLVDKNGVIRYRHVGVISFNKFTQKMLPIYLKLK